MDEEVQALKRCHVTLHDNVSRSHPDIILKLTIIFVAVICTLFQNEIIDTFVHIIIEGHKILIHWWNISRFRFSIHSLILSD